MKKTFLKTTKGRTCFVAIMLVFFMVLGSVCIALQNVVRLTMKVGIHDFDRDGKAVQYLIDYGVAGTIDGYYDGYIEVQKSSDTYSINALPNEYFRFDHWKFEYWHQEYTWWKQSIRFSVSENYKAIAYFSPDYDSDAYQLKLCDDGALLGIKRTDRTFSEIVYDLIPHGDCTFVETQFGYRLTLEKEQSISTFERVQDLMLIPFDTEEQLIRLLYGACVFDQKVEVMELFDGIYYRGAFLAIPVPHGAEAKNVGMNETIQVYSYAMGIAFFEVGGNILPYCGEVQTTLPTGYDKTALAQKIDMLDIVRIAPEALNRTLSLSAGTSPLKYASRGGGNDWRTVNDDAVIFSEYKVKILGLQERHEAKIVEMKQLMIDRVIGK